MLDMKDQLFDIRVVQRYIKLGRLSAADYDKYLASLEDSAADAVETDTRFSSAYEQRHYPRR